MNTHNIDIYATIDDLQDRLSSSNWGIRKIDGIWYHDSLVKTLCEQLETNEKLDMNLFEVLKDLNTFLFDHTTSDCILRFR